MIRLPYPAGVYIAAAILIDKLDTPAPLEICVQNGPHVPGDDCTRIAIGDLLRGVAAALEPK